MTVTLDAYRILADEEELAEAITAYTKGRGNWDAVSVAFEHTDRRAVRWQRSYRYIEWHIPKALLLVRPVTVLDIIARCLDRVEGCPRPLAPETVTEIRAVLGWKVTGYDADGHSIPEPETEASE